MSRRPDDVRSGWQARLARGQKRRVCPIACITFPVTATAVSERRRHALRPGRIAISVEAGHGWPCGYLPALFCKHRGHRSNVSRYAVRKPAIAGDFAGGSARVPLGALAAFIAVLISRLNRIIDRTVVLNGIPDHDTVRSRLKVDLPRLMRRAAMLNRAIFWAVVASISVTLLVIVAFVTAFFQLQHELRGGHLLHDFAGRFHNLAGRFCPRGAHRAERVRSLRLTR